MTLPVADPYWDQVVLAMRMDGANNSTTFTDLKGKAVTRYGSPVISTTVSKLGGASAYFPGAAALLTTTTPTDFAFGSGAFTFDAWVYRTVGGQPLTLVDKTYQYLSGGVDFRFEVNANGNLAFLLGPNISWYGGDAAAVPLNTLTHVAVVRSGNTLYFFSGGVLRHTVTVLGVVGNLKSELSIGAANSDGTRANFFQGYIDQLRVTRAARWTTNFSPPEMPLGPAVAGTVRDHNGALCARTVRAYLRSSGALVASAASDATTGEFVIPVATTAAHTVIAIDDDPVPDLNALIFDRVTPVNI